LRQAWRRGAQFVAGFGGEAHAPRDHVARLDEGDVFAVGLGHFGVAQAHELVDVELVIGEQHEVLEPLGLRAGVVAQTVQRVIHARRGEQRQRLRFAGPWLPGAVGDAVVHGGQVGQVEQVAHQHAALCAELALHMVVLGKREVDGDGVRAGAHFQFHAVVLAQQAELLQVVVGKQIGSRECGLVAPGAFNEAIGQLAVGARHGAGVHAHEGVEGAHGGWRGVAGHKALHCGAQVADLLLVDALHLGQGVGRVFVAGGGDEIGDLGHGAIVHKRTGTA